MTDLTARMRTCAAHLVTASIVANPAAIDDAAALLNEAADMLDGLIVPLPPGEPMEIIPPPPDFAIDRTPTSMWIAPGGPLPGLTRSGTVSSRACPKCDSRAAKKVYRQGNNFVLECPVCGYAWQYR